jgi:hypothetical protein
MSFALRADFSLRKITLAVMLRLTAMDVCCGPPELAR